MEDVLLDDSSDSSFAVDVFKNEEYQLQVFKDQLVQCDQDLQRLRELRQEAIENLELFVHLLPRRKDIPSLQSVSIIPEIDVRKYRESLMKFSILSSMSPSTRRRGGGISSPVTSLDANIVAEELFNQLVQLQESFKEDISSSSSWSSILDVTGDIHPTSSVLELRKMKENLLKYKTEATTTTITKPVYVSKPKLSGYAPIHIRKNKKKKKSLFVNVVRGRGRPPGLMKKAPWTEVETSILKEWIKTNESDMKKGYYEKIHQQLRSRPPSEIREKVQTLLNENLALFDSDNEVDLKDDSIYDE